MKARIIVAAAICAWLPTLIAAQATEYGAKARQSPAIGRPDEKTSYELERLKRLEGTNQVSAPEFDAILDRIRARLDAASGWSIGPAVKVEDCSGYVAWTRPFDRVRICRNVLLNARSEDEVAWLVAHEYGHLARGDSVRVAGGLTEPESLNRSLWSIVVLGAIIVAPPAAIGVPALYGRTQTAVVGEAGRRSKRDELEADEFAFQLVSTASYNPLAGLRALACIDAQTADCAMSGEAETFPERARQTTSEQVVKLIAPMDWIRAPTHPSMTERVARATKMLQKMAPRVTGFVAMPSFAPSSAAAEYQRRIAVIDDLSVRAARLYADTAASRDPARVRAAWCDSRGLPHAARTLLTGNVGQDRAIRRFSQAIGLLCSNDDLVLAGAEFGASSSYIGDLAAFVWRTRQQNVRGDDSAYRRLVVKYGDNEEIYRELRWIGPLMERQVNFAPFVRESCLTSPFVQRRQAMNKGPLAGGQDLKMHIFCSQTELYGPTFSDVDLQAAYWFDPVRAKAYPTRFWPAMMIRLNFDLHCIAQSGLVLAKKEGLVPS